MGFYSPQPQGPDETRRKPLKKWVILIALQFRYTFYRPQTKRLRARKIGLQYFTRHFVPRSPFGRRAVRQRGYGLGLLIFTVWVKMHYTALFRIVANLTLAEQFFGYNLRSQTVEVYIMLYL